MTQARIVTIVASYAGAGAGAAGYGLLQGWGKEPDAATVKPELNAKKNKMASVDVCQGSSSLGKLHDLVHVVIRYRRSTSSTFHYTIEGSVGRSVWVYESQTSPINTIYQTFAPFVYTDVKIPLTPACLGDTCVWLKLLAAFPWPDPGVCTCKRPQAARYVIVQISHFASPAVFEQADRLLLHVARRLARLIAIALVMLLVTLLFRRPVSLTRSIPVTARGWCGLTRW